MRHPKIRTQLKRRSLADAASEKFKDLAWTTRLRNRVGSRLRSVNVVQSRKVTIENESKEKLRVPHPCDFQGCGFLRVNRNPLERRYGKSHLHFITFSCIRRRPLLGEPEARTCFVRIFDEVRTRYQFRLIGYVVMPEHVHLLMTEPPTGNLSTAIQVLKQRASVLLPFRKGNCHGSEGHFWYRRFYDFNVYSRLKMTEKLSYMHLNPLNRNLVVHPRDWPWSSWSHYAGEGPVLIAIDRWDEPASRAENPHP